LKEIAWTQSHVVRAPLSNIMAIAELLSSGVDDGETQDQLLTHLSKAAVELDAIVKDIVRKTEVINSFKEE
ncbi:MAG: putative diguanylate cyclase YegE, partial [Pedobacter sp.]|nr:putative diguanylate cyclase YegE [Pedobacter sp.]